MRELTPFQREALGLLNDQAQERRAARQLELERACTEALDAYVANPTRDNLYALLVAQMIRNSSWTWWDLPVFEWPRDPWLDALGNPPAGARTRLWDEDFAPVWDSRPPKVTAELDRDEWARWHTRAPGWGVSAARATEVRRWVGEMIGSVAPHGVTLEEGHNDGLQLLRIPQDIASSSVRERHGPPVRQRGRS